MGMPYRKLFSNLTGRKDTSNGNGKRPAPYHLTPEIAAHAREARRNGMLVFITEQTLDKLETLLGSRPSKRFMRQLMEKIGNGELKITEADTAPLHNATLSNGNGQSRVLYTLQQAARALGVRSASLYHRARTNRIVATRVGSRYLLDQHEVDRLKQVGL